MLLITPSELRDTLPSARPPLVLDVRPTHEFVRGHLEGAIHLDLWGVSLIDTSEAPLRAFMWMIGHLFAARGIAPDRTVVLYEEDSGMRAARVFWLLEYLGHPDVRVLDGGLRVWAGAGLPQTTQAIAPTPGEWHGTPTATAIATWQDVLSRLGQAATVIVDTRSDDEFFGRVARAKRAGAIPGAVHLEWTHNLAPDGRFKSASELRAQYAALGVTGDREVITYCQGGYRAAHTYLALRIAGLPRLRNYTGSWKEWGDREDLPLGVAGPTL
ncbi:MAG: sulfurtransferase [Acidobacteriota bacterium]